MTLVVYTPTNNLEESKNFYKKLNYEIVSEQNPCLIANKGLIIEINPDRYSRAGVKIYKRSWTKEVERLKQKTSLHEISKGYLLNDFNGCWIYLIEDDFKFKNKITDKGSALTGNFVGLSLECSDIQKSLEIWKLLGFNIKMGSPDNSFVVLENTSGFKVSLMKPLTCPHLFFNPSMTYFNGENNLSLIEKIRATDIPITEEITYFNKNG